MGSGHVSLVGCWHPYPLQPSCAARNNRLNRFNRAVNVELEGSPCGRKHKNLTVGGRTPSLTQFVSRQTRCSEWLRRARKDRHDYGTRQTIPTLLDYWSYEEIILFDQ